MTEYFPDLWVIVKIHSPYQPIYKIFGTWLSGFDEPENWRLNSGIVRAEYKKGKYLFYGNSGSVYHCHEDNYGTSLYSSSVLKRWIDEADIIFFEILPKDVDPLSLITEVDANETL
jgi:hypothetical protein